MYFCFSTLDKKSVQFYCDAIGEDVEVGFNEGGSVLEGTLNYLKNNGLSVTQCDGIGVFFGGESFTVARTVATVANTLAYALSIPVVLLSARAPSNLSDLFKKATPGTYISATYSGPPRIGNS